MSAERGRKTIAFSRTLVLMMAGAGAFALSHMAYAGPAGCVVNGNVATCTGDQSGGVLEGPDFDSPPVTTLIVESDTAIAPVAGNSGIDISGEDIGLIDMTIRVPDGITVVGPIAAGINAGLAAPGNTTPYDGDVIIDSIADITATGTDVQGISGFVTGDGSVSITSVGNITVNSTTDFGQGIQADAQGIGNAMVDSNGDIATTNVDAISVFAGAGNATIVSMGAISTVGDNSSGLSAATGDGVVSIDSTGNIQTNGMSSHAIQALINGNVTITSVGNLLMEGDGSAGIVVGEGADPATADSVMINSTGNIQATGTGASYGIVVGTDIGTDVTVVSHGNISGSADAIAIDAPGGVVDITVSGGSITGGVGTGIAVDQSSAVASSSILIESDASVSSASGVAITSGAQPLSIENRGLLEGGLLLGGTQNTVTNTGTFETGTTVQVGTSGVIYNSGVLSPFGAGTAGTTNVDGYLWLQSGSTLSLDLTDAGSDSVIVGRQAQLDGTINLNAISPQGDYAAGDLYYLLDADEGIFGFVPAFTHNFASLIPVGLISRDYTQVAVALTDNGVVLSDGCTGTAASVTCSGDIDDGITNLGLDPSFASPTVTSLTINNLTDQLQATSHDAIEVVVSQENGFELTVDTGSHGLLAIGDNVEGIDARNYAGDLTLNSSGSITTTGSDAFGIRVRTQGGGNITIISSSDIETTNPVPGLRAAGMVADTQDGDITIENSGDITTHAYSSPGLYTYVAGEGNISIINTGDITTSDLVDAYSIYAEVVGAGDIVIDSQDVDLLTGGDANIWAETPTGDITITASGTLGDSNLLTLNNGDMVPTQTGIRAATTDGKATVSFSGTIDAEDGIVVNATEFDVTASGVMNVPRGRGITAYGTVGRVVSNTEISGDIDAISVGADDLEFSSVGNLTASRGNNSFAVAHLEGTDRLQAVLEGDITIHNDDVEDYAAPLVRAEVGRLFDENALADVDISVTGDLTSTGRGSPYNPDSSPAGGIFVYMSGNADVDVDMDGTISTNGAQSPGISVHFREQAPDFHADIDVTADGSIDVLGELSDALRVNNRPGGTATFNLSGGDFTGGTGDSKGMFFDSQAGAVGILNLDSGTLSARSGIAVAGADGDETVNNLGLITGDVLLGAGVNAVNNLLGGTFAGNANVDLGAGNVFTNAGTLSPGNSIGTTNINGQLVLEATSDLRIEIDRNGSGANVSDVVMVSGATTLGGTLTVNPISALTVFANGDAFDFLFSAGGISGGFASLVDSLPDLDVVYSTVDGTTGRLTLSDGSTPVSDVSDKSIHPASLQAVTANGRLFSNLLLSRGRTGGNMPAAQETATFALARFDARHAAGAAPENEPGATATFVPGGVGRYVWISGFGADTDVATIGMLQGYDSREGGMALGFEQVMPAGEAIVTLGIAGGISGSGVSAGASSADIGTKYLGVHASAEIGNLLISGALSYGFKDFDYSRVILVGGVPVVASGDANGRLFSGSAVAAYDIADHVGLGGRAMRLAPYARLDRVVAQRDAFTETGAGMLNLTVAGDDMSQTISGLGLDVSGTVRLQSGIVLLPSFDLRWEHVFGDVNTTTTSAIAGVSGADFTATGAPSGRNRLVLGTGVEIEFSDKVSATLRYEGVFASGFASHAGQARLRMRF